MQPVIPPAGMDEGVYFDLSEEVYHRDPAIGSTDVRRLMQGPSAFHYVWAGNPDQEEDEDTSARLFGRAVHKLVLEGQQAFDGLYACRPEGDDVLASAEDMRAWLKNNSMMAKGTKDAMAERILAINPHVRIQHLELERLEADGRTILDAAAYRRIMMASAYITKNPHLARSFEGGNREISVFWIRRGIRMKARFDYLRVIRWDDRRCAVISDLKSFGRVKPGQPLIQAVREAAAGYKHQAAHYLDGLRAAKRLISNGLVHGTTQDEWLQRVATSQTALFAFVFFRSSGAPYAQAQLLSPQNPILEIARRDIEGALDTFSSYFAHFGAEGPWISLEEPEELSIDDLPRWAL